MLLDMQVITSSRRSNLSASPTAKDMCLREEPVTFEESFSDGKEILPFSGECDMRLVVLSRDVMLSRSPTLRLTLEPLKLDELSRERVEPGEAIDGGVCRSKRDGFRLSERILIASGPKSNEESVCIFLPICGP